MSLGKSGNVSFFKEKSDMVMLQKFLHNFSPFP